MGACRELVPDKVDSMRMVVLWAATMPIASYSPCSRVDIMPVVTGCQASPPHVSDKVDSMCIAVLWAATMPIASHTVVGLDPLLVW